MPNLPTVASNVSPSGATNTEKSKNNKEKKKKKKKKPRTDNVPEDVAAKRQQPEETTKKKKKTRKQKSSVEGTQGGSKTKKQAQGGTPPTKKKEKTSKGQTDKKGNKKNRKSPFHRTTGGKKKPKSKPPLSILLPYVGIVLHYGPPSDPATHQNGPAPAILTPKRTLHCTAERWSSSESRQSWSGFPARKLKRAGDRKFHRKERTMFGSRYGSNKYDAGPTMIVSTHAKQRFRQRGRFTIPVYKDISTYEHTSATLVLTYVPQGGRAARGAKAAHGTIRAQIDHLKKYASDSSRWPIPRLPRYDALIWNKSKMILRNRTIQRRNHQANKRAPEFDGLDE